MSERRTAHLFKKESIRGSEDEWLGPESHMPNLGRELRRREARGVGISSGWIVGAILAAGCLVMGLFDRRSQISK
jgi:hypothetical protein